MLKIFRAGHIDRKLDSNWRESMLDSIILYKVWIDLEWNIRIESFHLYFDHYFISSRFLSGMYIILSKFKLKKWKIHTCIVWWQELLKLKLQEVIVTCSTWHDMSHEGYKLSHFVDWSYRYTTSEVDIYVVCISSGCMYLAL